MSKSLVLDVSVIAIKYNTVVILGGSLTTQFRDSVMDVRVIDNTIKIKWYLGWTWLTQHKELVLDVSWKGSKEQTSG